MALQKDVEELITPIRRPTKVYDLPLFEVCEEENKEDNYLNDKIRHEKMNLALQN